MCASQLLCVCSAVEGSGVDLTELICLALRLLRRLLQLSPNAATEPSSPIVSSLAARPASSDNNHLILVLAQYIYHRHNAQLPTLATKLLTTLSAVSLSLLRVLFCSYVAGSVQCVMCEMHYTRF